MPSGSNVARRYAEGAFQLAVEEKSVDTWREEMARLDELLQDEVLVAAFKNPAVTMPRRMELARRLAPELRPQSLNFMRLLIEHHRTVLISAIRQEFERLADEAAGILHARLTTAIALDGDDRRRYQEALARRLGRDVRVTYDTDGRLLGGATIQMGDHLVDGSIRTQLLRMRQRLLE